MGAPMPDSLRAAMHRAQPDEWAIPCPGCGAKVGSTCRKPRGGVPPGGVHPSRADAWLVHQHAA
jgi:hypothetical protein